MDFRNLPRVEEKVRVPKRLSQTLLWHANHCPRSAFLALKYRNGPATVEMDRGTALHLFGQEMMTELVTRGESSLYAPAPGEDGVRAAGEVAALTKAMVEGILADRRDLVLPAHEREHVREMAYHLAVGNDVDPAHVAGIERLFVLDLPNGWTISGKIDLLSLPEVGWVHVDDYKSSLAVPDQEAFESKIQLKLYGLLVMYGQPVQVDECTACGGTGRVGDLDRPSMEVTAVAVMLGAERSCAACDGRGYVETRLPPIGEHLRYVRGREIYPRPKPKVLPDGRWQLVQRSVTWSRQQIADFRSDAEWITDVIEHGLETGDWPARHDPTHCTYCPAEMECPLPRHLRRFAGALDSVEKASEALVWAERMGAKVAATRTEVRKFAEAAQQPIPVSEGKVYDFVTSFSRSVKRKGRNSDWDGLVKAVWDAQRYGQAFEVGEWVIERPKTEFKQRDAAPGEVSQKGVADGRDDDRGATGGDGADGAGSGERFGDEPPF